MNPKDCIIILPTHSRYIGICKNFLELFEKNWEDCPYKVVVSLTGDYIEECRGYEILYNGPFASLTECIVNAVEKYDSSFQICFLGDAFINKKVNQQWIISTLQMMKSNSIEYCSLVAIKNYKKKMNCNDDFRYIHSKDRYSHTFVAFITSRQFVFDIIKKCKSDVEFEENFLKNQDHSFYYNNHIIVRKNKLGILPAITKGKWNRIAYYKLIHDNPEIGFEKRKIETLGESVFQYAHDIFISMLPDGTRIAIKYFMKKILNKSFETDE